MCDPSILYYVLYRSDYSLSVYELQQLSTLFQIFQGNTNVSSVVRHDLNPVIRAARYIRIHPGYYTGDRVCLRLELYGCVLTVETGL